MARREELTDEQWSLIEPLFDKADVVQTRGRPPRDAREVLNGVLWILRSGARWQDLPDRFPPYQTCHRRFQKWVKDGRLRFQKWVKDGRLRKVLETLAEDLHSRGKLDLSECFIDGTFVSAKKGASRLERPSGARVLGFWQWQSVLVFLSPFTQASASPHEVKLVGASVCERFTEYNFFGFAKLNLDNFISYFSSIYITQFRNCNDKYIAKTTIL